MDEISNNHANQTIKLTTRQAFQFHGILKRNLKQSMKEINDSVLDSIAACGDVNRNTMCNPNPYQSKVHKEVNTYATDISNHLLPRTGAYHEIWLDGEKVLDSSEERSRYTVIRIYHVNLKSVLLYHPLTISMSIHKISDLLLL